MTGLSDDRAGMSATPTPLQPPIDLTTYRTAVVPDSIGQIVTSFGGFLAVTALMYLLADRALSGAGFLAWAGLLPLAVLAAGFVPVGPPRFARFDPPFKPWFLRRNEVVQDVTRAPRQGQGG